MWNVQYTVAVVQYKGRATRTQAAGVHRADRQLLRLQGTPEARVQVHAHLHWGFFFDK